MPTIKPVKGGFRVTHTTREIFGVDDICERCGIDHGANSCAKRIFNVFWAPEGRKIATVATKDARAAKRLAPLPYRKYLGEIYVEEVL